MSSTCTPSIGSLLQAIEMIEGVQEISVIKKVKKARICSYCHGSDGHNATTCEVKWQLFGFLMDDIEKPARLCGYCACDGHDKRNCHLHHIATNFFEVEEVEVDPLVRHLTFDYVPMTPFMPAPTLFTTPETTGCRKVALFTAPETTGRRKVAHETNHGTQVVDFDVVDEPWVWAPIRRPTMFL